MTKNHLIDIYVTASPAWSCSDGENRRETTERNAMSIAVFLLLRQQAAQRRREAAAEQRRREAAVREVAAREVAAKRH